MDHHKHHKPMGFYKHTDAAGNFFFICQDANGNNRWIKLTTTNPEISSGSIAHDEEISEELFDTVFDEVGVWLRIGTHPPHAPGNH